MLNILHFIFSNLLNNPQRQAVHQHLELREAALLLSLGFIGQGQHQLEGTVEVNPERTATWVAFPPPFLLPGCPLASFLTSPGSLLLSGSVCSPFLLHPCLHPNIFTSLVSCSTLSSTPTGT